jgi:N-acetylglucosamine-6-phosphate deacetylase
MIPHIKRSQGGHHGANIIGLHLEGPFISTTKKGAHPAKYIRDLSGGFNDLNNMYGGNLDDVSIITIAPELDPACQVVKECVNKGITVSLGHSAATLEEAEAAVRGGARLITHLFNAMTVFHHRADPGILGLLTSKRLDNNPIFYGLIADGIHTHPTALRIAVRTDMRGLCVVSDAIGAMGLTDGNYALGQQEIEVQGERAVIAGTETLCGASATLYTGVRNLIKYAECTVVEALEAATLHPAQALGIQDKKGTLSFGADADFILVDKDSLELDSTWIAGQNVYNSKN